MAFSLLTHLAQGSTDGNGFTSTSIDTTGATLLVFSVSFYFGTPTVSDSKGNTWVSAVVNGVDNVGWVQIFSVKNPATGTGHTFSVVGTSSYPSIEVAAFSGNDTTAAVDQTNSATSAGAAALQPGSITPSANNELVVSAACYNPDAVTLSVDSSLAITDQITPGSGTHVGGGLAYIIQTTAGAVNPSWSESSANLLAAAIASFKSATLNLPPGVQRTSLGTGAIRLPDNQSFTISHFPAISVAPKGAQSAAVGAVRPPDNQTFTGSLNRGFDAVLPVQPSGVQQVTPSASQLAPRATDNWTYAPGSLQSVVSTAQPKMPPGAQLFTPAAIAPHQGDNWSFSVVVNVALPPQPPGAQQITPTAQQLAPRAGDNWATTIRRFEGFGPFQALNNTFGLATFGASFFVTQPSIPIGLQVVTPGFIAQPGPTYINAGLTQPVIANVPGVQVISPAAVSPHASDNWSFITSCLAPVALTFEGYGTSVYGVGVYGGQPLPIVMPAGVQIVTQGTLPPLPPPTYALEWYLGLAPLTAPPGVQSFVLPAPSPHISDNWTELAWRPVVAVPTLPPGQQSVVVPVPSPHVTDNWAFNVLNPQNPTIPQGVPPGVQSFAAPAPSPHLADNWTLLDLGPPIPMAATVSPMPPGAQAVDPPALSPHIKDNWTYASCRPGDMLLSLVAPPGKPLIISVPPIAPPPTWSTSLYIGRTAIPEGIESIDPPAKQIIPNWTFTVSQSPGYAAPPSLPPGTPYLAPAAVPPHQGDNWSTSSVLGRWNDTVQPSLPPGQQIGADTLVWHSVPNYTWVWLSSYMQEVEDEPYSVSTPATVVEPSISTLGTKSGSALSTATAKTGVVISTLTEYEDKPN